MQKRSEHKKRKIFNFKFFGYFCKFRRISLIIFVEKHGTASFADCHEVDLRCCYLRRP